MTVDGPFQPDPPRADFTDREWIDYVARLADWSPTIRSGGWRGYGNYGTGRPFRGRFALVRWEEPSVAVASDDPQEALALAKAIERRVTGAWGDDRRARGRRGHSRSVRPSP